MSFESGDQQPADSEMMEGGGDTGSLFAFAAADDNDVNESHIQPTRGFGIDVPSNDLYPEYPSSHSQQGYSSSSSSSSAAAAAAAVADQPTIIVHQPGFGAATIRRRQPQPEQSMAAKTHHPVTDSGANFILTTLTLTNEHYEMTKIRVANRCAPRMERCYRRLTDMRRFFCCMAALCIVVIAVTSSTSDQTAFVEDSMRPQYARHGHDGVDLHRPSVALQCSDIRSRMLRPLIEDNREDTKMDTTKQELSLDRVRASAEYLVREDDLPCVCAPALGVPRRYMAVAIGHSAETGRLHIEHLHNPTIDREWDGHVDSTETRMDVRARSYVTENQRMLFPDRTESVEVVRFNTIRLSYQDDECRAGSLVLVDEHAWCAQACHDLFDGRSVYDHM